MSDQVITNLEQVTNEWLTAVLTGSGALTQGHVAGFDAAVIPLSSQSEADGA